MRSGVWSTTSSVTSKRSRSASTTSRTSTSGADAPAVIPTVRRLAEPVPIDVGCALDQARRDAHPLGDLGEAQRIAAVGRADHQHPLALRRDRLDRRLAIRGRVANVLAARRADRREAASAVLRRSPRCRRPKAWSGSGKRDSRCRADRRRRRHRRFRSASSSRGGTWPKVPITSGWPAWPMKRMCRPSSISRSRLAMDLGNERAGRIDIGEAAILCLRPGPPWARRARRRRPAGRRALRRARRRTPRPVRVRRSTTKRLWTISWRT